MANLRPMLAQAADPLRLSEYVKSNDWMMQPKADGQRYLIVIEDGDMLVLNRQGQPKSSNLSYGILAEVEKLASQVKGKWVLDGEYVEGDHLLLFDLPLAGGLVALADGFAVRLVALEQMYALWKPDPAKVSLVPTAASEDEKLTMLHTAEEQHREGVILRHVKGPYQSAYRSPHLLKYKFVKECDAIVRAIGVADNWTAHTFTVNGVKDNALLCLLDPEAGKPINIGVASTIGKKPIVEPGQVWEVRFLYVLDPKNPRLYQPRLMRCRDGEKALEECLFSQLNHAWTDKSLHDKTRQEM